MFFDVCSLGNVVTSSKTELRKSQSGKRTKRKPRVLFSQVSFHKCPICNILNPKLYKLCVCEMLQIVFYIFYQ